jgi:hypothetical protein
MKYSNYYLLLDLSLTPPEEDQEKIEAAIKKKQAEWSKLRNHPTHGIQAKQFIGFIPEIRRIMADPDLRKQEAEKAKNILAEQNKDKFSVIDRHLSIYQSKGIVTSQEIQKLVKIHSVETDEILKWMLKKEKEKKASPISKEKDENKAGLPVEKKLEEILKSLAIRIRKGFILEEEISYLSKTYNIDQGDITKNIPFPVQTKKDPSEAEVPKPLDQTIFKTINDNLKILGKKTLYEFLELPVGSDLETLRKRADKIQKDLLGVSKKDATVTAGSILAGHCRTIFKLPETRISYDISRARSILELLDSDIDIAEFDGVVRSEYTDAIIKNAAELGMSYEEAYDYIEEYCLQKSWKVKSKQKRKRLLMVTSIAASVIIVVIAASIFLITYFRNKQLSQEFSQILTTIEAQKNLENKKQTLIQYIKSRGKNPFTMEAEKKINLIENQIKKRNALEEKGYQSAIKEASTLLADQKYEKAQAIYTRYLEKYPDGKHAQEINKNLSGIPNLIETRDFQTINQIPDTDLPKRLEAAKQYLKNYPQGQFQLDVEKTIMDMEEPYFILIRQEITLQEKQKNWKACIEICDRYVTFFPESKHENQLKGERYFFAKQLEKTNLLQQLAQKVEMKKNDPDVIIEIYTDYLKKNPDSPIQYEVQKLISMAKKNAKK